MQTMQMALPDDQILNQSMLCHLMAKFATDASGVIWWPNLQLMQVALSGGQICNECKWHQPLAKFATLECKWCHVVAKFSPCYGVSFWVRCASGNVCSLYLSLAFPYTRHQLQHHCHHYTSIAIIYYCHGIYFHFLFYLTIP